MEVGAELFHESHWLSPRMLQSISRIDALDRTTEGTPVSSEQMKWVDGWVGV